MSTYNKKGKLYCDIKKDSNDQDITSQSHEWFSLGTKTYFYWRQINKCIYMYFILRGRLTLNGQSFFVKRLENNI